jgi:hypothetical protein
MLLSNCGSGRDEEPAENSLPDSNPLETRSLEKITPACQARNPQPGIRRFEFEKSSQFFIRVHNETLSVVAVRIRNPDCLPSGINR